MYNSEEETISLSINCFDKAVVLLRVTILKGEIVKRKLHLSSMFLLAYVK